MLTNAGITDRDTQLKIASLTFTIAAQLSANNECRTSS